MSVLTVKNISHGFGDRAIFEDVSFRLLKGEHVGLIGANGEGKSTFMNIITSKLMPDDGQVIWSNNVRVGYMDQHANLEKGLSIRDVLRGAFQYLFDLETEMNELYGRMGEMDEDEMTKALERTAVIQDMLDNNGFYVIDAKVEEIAKGLGLLDVGLDKDVTALSGGQRTKVLLSKLLLETPDILLLDEPTNYLDEAHIEWLKRYLQSYENAFVLISHDIPFLNSVINLIYHVEDRKLSRYVGDYEEFRRIYDAKKEQLEKAYERQQSEIARLEDFVARNKANVATSNMAKSRQKKLDKIDRIEISKEKPKPVFNFKMGRAAGKVIFETKDLVIGYDTPLTKHLNISMERGQKVALVGANGLGKTTLLKSLMGAIKPIEGEVELGDYQQIGYFEQEGQSGNKNTCIEEYWKEFPSCTQYEVRAALAR
ncbi:ABC-F family ATP-binding cassette domain-containing protein, partial [Clostridium sp.]|uniref:ABC-F family ATP-binding cassette domain-containing protein n=1 Tax=Clostridium sp. TaxID=1506 RepID=UPI0032167239